MIDTSKIEEPRLLFSNSYNNLIEAVNPIDQSFDIRFRAENDFYISDSDGFIRLYRFDDSTFTPLAEKFCHYEAVKNLEIIGSKRLIFTGARV